MIWFLRVLFGVVVASMLWVTTWASFRCPLFAVPREVFAHPWFIAIMLLGNIAMASYCLSELFSLPAGGRPAELLTARRSGPGLLGLMLAATGAAVVLLA